MDNKPISNPTANSASYEMPKRKHVINQKSIEIEKGHLFRFRMIHHQPMACYSIYFINQQTFI